MQQFDSFADVIQFEIPLSIMDNNINMTRHFPKTSNSLPKQVL